MNAILLLEGLDIISISSKLKYSSESSILLWVPIPKNLNFLIIKYLILLVFYEYPLNSLSLSLSLSLIEILNAVIWLQHYEKCYVHNIFAFHNKS